MKTSAVQVLAAAVIIGLGSASTLAGQHDPSPRGKVALQVYLSLGFGYWTKSEIDPISGQRINTLIGKGAGFGVRASYLLAKNVGAWASWDFAVATEGGYTSLFIGPLVRYSLAPRVSIDLRGGAGWLDGAPHAVGGTDFQVFPLPKLALAGSGEYTTPIGSGRRNTGSGIVTVEHDRGPRRLQFGFVWYPR